MKGKKDIMKFKLIDETLDKISADYELIFVVNKDLEHKFIKDIEEIQLCNYKGEGVLNLPNAKRIYVGVRDLHSDTIRQGSAKAYNVLKELNIMNLKMASYVDTCFKMSFQALAEGFIFGEYKFDRYKNEKKSSSLNEIFISTTEFDDKKVDIVESNLGLEHGSVIALATNFAKDIINEIPEIYTPIKMAEDASILASKYNNVECNIYDEKYLKSEGMNAFLAVNRASVNPPRLIHLKYSPSNKESIKKVVFVGKGLTYDSGGLSLKPADYMLTMKADKSGAAAAMAIIQGVAELNLPFEIHSVLGVAENMIGGNAYKPDDVLISRNGVTIEVRNTDAEGRLVLADCLDWAQDKLKPDLLIDMATLTGACVVGLGEYTSGIMGNNYELQKEFKELSKKSGELMSILEFNDYLKELIKSQIADVSNSASSRYGGAITAGLFLDKFIKDEFKDKWLHLDIAGPAYVEKAWGYNAAGATGAGVRANLYYLNKLARNYEKGKK